MSPCSLVQGQDGYIIRNGLCIKPDVLRYPIILLPHSVKFSSHFLHRRYTQITMEKASRAELPSRHCRHCTLGKMGLTEISSKSDEKVLLSSLCRRKAYETLIPGLRRRGKLYNLVDD